MATKQFGRLKLHWSKRGLAYRWGDGEIHRLSFERNAGDGGQRPYDGYDPGDPNAPEYRDYGRGYEPGDPYAGPEQQPYEGESGGYYPDEGAPAGRYDVLYRSDWLTWLLLIVLPPLGIWLLWKRERLEPKPRLYVSGAAAVWFIVLLIWIISGLSGRGADQTVGVGNYQAPQTIVVGQTPTPAPTSVLTNNLTTAETPAPAEAQTTPRPGGNPGSSNSGNTLDTPLNTSDENGIPASDNTDTTYVWAANGDSYYHKTNTCSKITGSPTKVSLDIARNRGQTACPVCYGTQDNGATYYMTKGGRYYHKDKTCSSMRNPQAVTKAQAVKLGKKPCPICVGSYYATRTGNYYHTNPTCSGMKNAQLVTKAAAVRAGKLPCPVCVKKTSSSKNKSAAKTTYYYSTVGGKYYHSNPTCSGMKNARKITLATAKKRSQKPCPVCIGAKSAASTAVYYATSAGKYYHTKANCSGMKNARRITLATAKAKGKLPCPVCVKASATNYVYATAAGKYYHSNPTCSGMKDARKVTLAGTKKAGKTACPICMKSKVAAYYYSTVGGKYYHANPTCSGMKNATKVTLATAKKRGQTPCPVCLKKQAQAVKDAKITVYATTGGKYYHSRPNCSGMKNARKVTLASAKASGKTACPVCMKTSKDQAPNAPYVYAKLSGRYYHKAGCPTSDADGAKKVALETARKYGKTACPVCFKRETVYVYVTPAGLKYHSKVDCGGIHNTMKITLKTALARKYVRCTVCDAPKP